MNKSKEKEFENWFIKRGLPHFINNYSATSDIFTRLLPYLTLLFIVELFFVGDLSKDQEILKNLALVVSVLGFVVVFWALVNALRKQKILAMPQKVGYVELATFVLLPPLLILYPGQQLDQAATFLVVNVVLLVVVYFGTSYGIFPITKWAVGLTKRQLEDVFGLLVRSLPLLLLFSAIIFLSSEIWQITSQNSTAFFIVSVSIIAMSGVLFAVFKVPSQIDEIESFDSEIDLQDRLKNTPAKDFQGKSLDTESSLSKKQRGNVGLVVVISEGLQGLLVSLLLFGFFVFFGVFVIPQEVLISWIGYSPNIIYTTEIFGQDANLSTELLRISVFVASLSGLYFVVSSLTDENYKKEFLKELIDEVQTACIVRRVYQESLSKRVEENNS